MEMCASNNIRLNGVFVTKSVLGAAMAYVEHVDEDTHNLLLLIERKYGKDILTSKSTHMARMIQVCMKEATDATKVWECTPSRLVWHVLQYIYWGFEGSM